MKRHVLALCLAVLLSAGLCSCALLQPPDSSASSELPSSSAGTGEEMQIKEIQRPSFLQAQDTGYDTGLKPSVAPYTVEKDFGNVINYDDFQYLFSDEARRMLMENGFVVLEGYQEEFFSLYEMNRYQMTPNFVTTDAMMHTYHLFFSRLLKGIERDHFFGALVQISRDMQGQSLAQMEELKGTEWENAAKRNVAFFSVALSLLEPESEIPAEVADVVAQELKLIGEANTICPSPVMNMGGDSVSNSGLLSLEEDYSQYIPRGYYTVSQELSRYFQAMMWYGRLSFRQEDQSQSQSALLMTMALEDSGAWESWEKIYTITSFFVGVSDDPGVYEYAPLIQQAYGGKPELRQLPQKEREWEAFVQAIAQLEPPAINSIPIYDLSIQPDREEAIRAFRFMGQRFTLDASIFQRLVYRDVEENSAGEKRMLPSALDVPAALGSKAAEEILTQTGAKDYKGYGENLSALQSYLSDPPSALWTGSLYGGWLHTLLPLLTPKGEGYPPFMQNDAWTVRGLHTFLGSWTELKHDTVLYAKQVYAEMGGGGIEEKDDRGYVEPEPVLYARLAGLADATAQGLSHYGVLKEEDADSLSRLKELAQRLVQISEKELKDQLLTEEEYELIRSFGGQLEHLWYEALKDEKNGEQITSTDFPAALVTDVATDPNGSVLQVGNGRIDNLFVLVNVDGSLRIAQGGVYSFYEFSQPLSERLTDETWRRMLGIDMLDENGEWVDQRVDVPRPEWTKRFRDDTPRG